jgi:geranylgeranyl diphosphate synthase type II
LKLFRRVPHEIKLQSEDDLKNQQKEVAELKPPTQLSANLVSSSREVEQELERTFELRKLQAAAYGTQFAALWEVAAECVLGGKLLRPKLMLSAFDALTATHREGVVFRDSAVRIAAAVELLHFSFLLHDDVIDGDLFRRGRLNLIGTVLQERDPDALPRGAGGRLTDSKDLHWARTSGILMGDLMLSAAHQIFAREALPDDMRTRLLDLLDHTITESVVGEHLDVGLSDDIVPADLNTVLSMSRLKTATYTFELPLKAAGILSGAAHRFDAVIGNIGRHLGVAFQLQDDLLSTFGSAAEHGKDAFSDLREGKETAIISYARMTSAWPSIEADFGNPTLSEADAKELRTLLSECGAEQFIRSLIEDQLRATFNLISSPDSRIPEELAQLFGQIAATLEDRRS